MKQPSLSLTAKTVLLVACMGTAWAMLTLYATWHMERIEAQYHQLLQKQAIAAHNVGNVRQHLADASALVHAVLTFHSEEQMLLAKEQLTQIQQGFEANLDQIYPLLSQHELEMDTVLTQARHVLHRDSA